MRKKEDKYDFRALGLAIKEARKKQGLTRENKIDNFTDADLVIMESVADGIVKSKEVGEM